MAWTQADLDRIEAAISDGGGVKSIAFSDQSVSFHSIDEMLKLRAVIAHAIGASGVKSFRYIATSKGV